MPATIARPQAPKPARTIDCSTQLISTELVTIPETQRQQAIDVDLILSFAMALIKAGRKTSTAKTQAAGLEKSDMPMNERNLKALADPF